MLLNDVDPITQEDVSEISPLFYLRPDFGSELNTKGKYPSCWYGFDPYSLYEYILTTGDTREPHTRREITPSELMRLDACLNTPLKRGTWWFFVTKQNIIQRHKLLEQQVHDDTIREVARIAYIREADYICNQSLNRMIHDIDAMIATYQGSSEKVGKLLIALWWCLTVWFTNTLKEERFVTSTRTTWVMLEEMKDILLQFMRQFRNDYNAMSQRFQRESVDTQTWKDAKSIIISCIIPANSVWRQFIQITYWTCTSSDDVAARHRVGPDPDEVQPAQQYLAVG